MTSLAYKISHCLSSSHNLELRSVICTGVTLFLVVLHLPALLSASQNRVIFSCVFLMIKMAKTGTVLIATYDQNGCSRFWNFFPTSCTESHSLLLFFWRPL